MYSAPK